MFHKRYLNKNRGMTLIETVVSMWILGIVIVSMLSFVGATMSKKNQNKIQAIAVAKSELQDSEVSIIVEGDLEPVDHATILLFKSSYLIDSENNESSIEPENSFYKKYIINSPKDSSNSKLAFAYGFSGLISSNSSNITRNDSNTNDLSGVLGDLIIEPISNSGGRDIIGNGSTVPLPNLDYNSIKKLFNNNIDEHERYNEYKNIEKEFIDYETNKIHTDDDILPGLKCFILLTSYRPTTIKNKEDQEIVEKINVNVKTLYSSEKKADGFYPLNIYEIDSFVRLGSGVVN